MRFFIIIVAVALMIASCQVAKHEQVISQGEEDSFIDALVSAKDLRVSYTADGAHDATIMGVDPVSEVRAIVNLGSEAIPRLIEHLDDSRPTTAVFIGHDGSKERVSVGHVCLDILTNIVEAPEIFIEDSGDDGFGASIKDGYHFPPYETSRSFMANVKAHWQRAEDEGKIKYKRPLRVR